MIMDGHQWFILIMISVVVLSILVYNMFDRWVTLEAHRTDVYAKRAAEVETETQSEV